MKRKVTNALDTKGLKAFINSSDIRKLSVLNHDIFNLLNFEFGLIDEARIRNIQIKISPIDNFIDFKIIFNRLNNMDQFRTRDPEVEKVLGIDLTLFFPELVELKNELASHLCSLPNSIDKAENWLFPIAVNAGADSDIEACIYFASKGEQIVDSHEIKSRWHKAICWDIVRGVPVGNLPQTTINRAKEGTLTLYEACKLLTFNESLPRFFSFRDEEENFIDTSLFRSVEWLNINGFEPWLSSIANDMSNSYHYGIDTYSSVHLFFWCRSNLALSMPNRIGLESFLLGLINGQIERNKPWRIAQVVSNYEITDYIPLASAILFCSNRINSERLSNSIRDEALNILFQTQLQSGGWSSFSNDPKSSILSTCMAIHALAILKPEGWKKTVSKAKEWLLKEQSPGGYWHTQGGPPVMLTVLVIDSINLASGNYDVTFTTSRPFTKQNLEENEVHFDYSNESWFKRKMPAIKAISKHEGKLFKPKIALVAAVQIELEHILKRLKPPTGSRQVLKVIITHEVYYLGRFGKFDSVVMMSNMGSTGVTGSMLAVDDLIRIWKPIGVVVLGIAFGASRKKHKVADVLIAECLIQYESQRVGQDEIIHRGTIPPSSPELISRIRNILDWQFLRPDNSKVDIHIGHILSGDKLVDSLQFKEVLLAKFPQAIGGEMEGSGLWASATRHKKSWILIKSVCDWGDGKKHKEYQPLAAASAVSLCEHLFSNQYALDGMK